MKHLSFFIAGISIFFIGSLWVIGQTCSGEPSHHGEGIQRIFPQTCEPDSVPILKRDSGSIGRDSGTLEHSEAMMRKYGFSEEKIHQMHIVSQTPVFLDDPAALYGQADELKLTTEQKTKLMSLIQETREKARKILTSEQKTSLGTVPDTPITMQEICREIHKKMIQMLKEKGETKGMACPMCPMMPRPEMHHKSGQTTQPAKE